MILHSIAPVEQVFPVDQRPPYEYRRTPYGYIQGVNVNGKFTISRLISTDPHRYLDPRYAPGGTLDKI